MGLGHLRLDQTFEAPRGVVLGALLLHLEALLGKLRLRCRWRLYRWMVVADAAGPLGLARMVVTACLDLMVVQV